ncbi:MAG: sulfurtransferase, partial [Okeania sp. SIO1H6]|nr:sulfurtransferase [Okeania sp. SIO1H6]
MTNKNFLISPQWLVDHLNDPNLIIIDCRFSLADPELGQKQYQDAHIPRAFYFDLNQDLSSAVQKHGGRHPLPDPDKLAQKLATIGVKYRETLIVAYDDSRFAFASRLWWLLMYMGHEKIALLDGGFSEWQKKYPITHEISTPQTGFFEPQIQSKMVLDIETVKAKKDLPEVVLVDSRDSDRYLGKHEPIDPIAGHIPGAVNYPWKQVTDENSL